MSYHVRFTLEAKTDIERLYGFLVEHDVKAAETAIDVIERAFSMLEDFPFSCRKAEGCDPFFRELLIPFGNAGYVALFEIEDQHTVTALAIRHQREDDYL